MGDSMQDDFDFDDGVQGRWSHLSKLFDKSGPAESLQTKKTLRNFRVLVIGAGGLGCEILKDLALSGFKKIEVIDMDTIDVSNLNRQFLFRRHDVGQSKAEIAAQFINKRIPGVNVIPHFKRIQEFDEDFYRGFNLVISGLDSIEARRWINGLLVSLIVKDPVSGDPDVDTIIPFIDGGTEGFKGQSRLLIPGVSACFECSLSMFPPATTFPLCTLANTPRVPEHCIQWASLIAWEDQTINKTFSKGTQINTDNPDHMSWLFEAARKRAEEHGIQGVTYKLTQGVVKNIIPAIASTNAIISASCVVEALKIATGCAGSLNNYMMFSGLNGVYTYTFEYEKNPECAVCGSTAISYSVASSITLKELKDNLAEDARFQFKKPSLRCKGKNLYMQGFLESVTKANLDKTLKELDIENDDEISITDPSLPSGLSTRMRVRYV
eukprot:TRINITY_DN317_c0_g1_i4.p1 TRINITY_DN317_c0_g1~~TRINITY_DN317_c0_g1_i4.p1  ORF type:complete len:438 (-),score=104.08 TRINITY_DN317_c0_g1_i4:177-1490(-)